MLLLAESIARLKIRWNERPLTEDDFHRLCKRHKITVVEMPLRVSGFYYCMMRRHFIAIDSKLPAGKKLFVMFHEFAHYLLHAPYGTETASYHRVGHRNRTETEADMFALCAMMPKAWVESERFSELAEDAGLDLELVRERLDIYDRFGL